jgi:hypothetical protein
LQLRLHFAARTLQKPFCLACCRTCCLQLRGLLLQLRGLLLQLRVLLLQLRGLLLQLLLEPSGCVLGRCARGLLLLQLRVLLLQLLVALLQLLQQVAHGLGVVVLGNTHTQKKKRRSMRTRIEQ